MYGVKLRADFSDQAVPVMIPSPCIGVCRIRPSSDFCIGCARSREEIANWPILTDEQKSAVWDVLPDRRAKMDIGIHHLGWSSEDLQTFVKETLRPDGGTWVSGVNGAIAEFCICADDDLRVEVSDQKIIAQTQGGAISLSLQDHGAALAVGSSDSSGRSIVVLAVPRVLARRFPGEGLASLGEDVEAIRPDECKATLYDFGLGRAAGAFCVRTNSETLKASLDACLGAEWQQVLGSAGGEILAQSPVRVVRHPIGRVEVYNPIPQPGGLSPNGPHTHFLPAQIAAGGDVPASLQIPSAYVPCAIYYPPRSEAPSDHNH
jgi:predicted Fe-S protein YdhL (DUF1289 family)